MVLNSSSNAPFRSAAFGPQPYSHRRNEPLYSFGTGTIEAKAALYLGKEFCPHQFHLAVSPGPGTYSISAPIPPINSRAQSAPAPHTATPVDVKWGASTTARMPAASLSARAPNGPGSNRALDDTVGQRFASAALNNSPRFSWTQCATRESQRSVYVSQGHEREMLGKFSPGPHVVGREAFESMGRQASSLRQTMPRFAPTKAPRSITFKSNDKSTWPGPGSYNY